MLNPISIFPCPSTLLVPLKPHSQSQKVPLLFGFITVSESCDRDRTHHIEYLSDCSTQALSKSCMDYYCPMDEPLTVSSFVSRAMYR